MPTLEDDLFDGHYELGELLGSGGMGNVYRAVQVSLGRRVAIKVPQPQLVKNALVARRFRAEALAGSRIDHRNIVRVMDFGERNGMQFLVMEYLPGVTLDRLLLEHGAMTSGIAAGVCGQVLDGLGAAHAAGVIHADIKSANVLVEERADGQLLARIIDFGLAHFINEPELQADRLLSGTPEYLAPEVIVGGVPSVASDVYAAGVILYELLTGTTPFGGRSNDEILRRHTNEAVVPPSLRAPDRNIGADLDTVVMCALAKHPARRFASAASFAAALRAAAAIKLPSYGADGDVIITSYLELARALIDRRELPRAILELEQALDHLRLETRLAKPSGTWRLQLCLATLYSGVGQPDRARAAASLGNADAIHAASKIGQERAKELIVRLAGKKR